MTDAANPNPTPSPAPDEIHWGVAYLREDIQDVRQDMRQQTQDIRQDMHQQIEGLRQDMHQQIGLIHSRIDETNKRIDSQFKWLITTMLAMTGILIAVIKL